MPGKSSQNALIAAWSASRFYNRTTAEGLINKLDWNIGQEIDGLITTSDVKNGRPHPEMIHLAISKCGLKKSSRVAKVGDFVIDIKEGESAVTTGVQSLKQLKPTRPTAVVDSLEEVADQLV